MGNIKEILSFTKPVNLKLMAVFVFSFFLTFHAPSLVSGNAAYAADAQCSIDNTTKLNTEDFRIKANTLVVNIVGTISTKLKFVSEQMYAKIIASGGYAQTIGLTIILCIMIYSILFVSGMTQIKLYDFVMMLIKIGVIFMLFTPTSWQFFTTYVVNFFNEGSVELINYFTSTGDVYAQYQNVPVAGQAAADITTGVIAFQAMDGALSKLFSSNLFVILLASATIKKYGLVMVLLLGLAIWLAFQSLLTAIWVYIMSLVMKTLLFGLAPIFIPTILFKRTRHLFDNWLNQIVSASLQPVLLFIFFMFFLKLMENSLDNILAHPVCWTKLNENWRGTPMDWYFWRFAEYKGETIGWMPDPDDPKQGFPIPMIHILTFLIVAELANRFNKVIVQIAMQIAQASVDLTSGMGSAFSNLTRVSRRTQGLGD